MCYSSLRSNCCTWAVEASNHRAFDICNIFGHELHPRLHEATVSFGTNLPWCCPLSLRRTALSRAIMWPRPSIKSSPMQAHQSITSILHVHASTYRAQLTRVFFLICDTSLKLGEHTSNTSSLSSPARTSSTA
jgi:hypothetical protein